MNKNYLISQKKDVKITYLCWLFIGCHYAYLGQWKYQFLYWITLGGLGVWACIDLFTIPIKVTKHNLLISSTVNDTEIKKQGNDVSLLTTYELH